MDRRTNTIRELCDDAVARAEAARAEVGATNWQLALREARDLCSVSGRILQRLAVMVEVYDEAGAIAAVDRAVERRESR